MTKWSHCAVLFLIGSLLSPQLYSQTPKLDERFSEASVAASEKQTKKIRQELRDLKDHDWAGEYYFGDGLGVNVSLALAPKGGFTFSWHGCLGLYDLNYGGVAFTNGTVKLLFKYPNKQEGFQGLAPELLPVRWGERHYLIAADHIVDFANAINAGSEPSSLFGGRSASFLLRRGDEKKPVSGQPNLPSEFLTYILAEPIKAKISFVEQTRLEHARRITNVRLDVGSIDGLKAGMELYVHSPSRIFETAVVTDVSEHSAKAVIEQMETTDPAPSTDWELSTKL
ncbi:MAG TPA: hypothetical protein VMT28_15540 [Terriglobales bacterium]|jgi:hypothetical protein|nr:hypothetical protein [Terriglobales bacterium]